MIRGENNGGSVNIRTHLVNIRKHLQTGKSHPKRPKPHLVALKLNFQLGEPTTLTWASSKYFELKKKWKPKKTTKKKRCRKILIPLTGHSRFLLPSNFAEILETSWSSSLVRPSVCERAIVSIDGNEWVMMINGDGDGDGFEILMNLHASMLWPPQLACMLKICASVCAHVVCACWWCVKISAFFVHCHGLCWMEEMWLVIISELNKIKRIEIRGLFLSGNTNAHSLTLSFSLSLPPRTRLLFMLIDCVCVFVCVCAEMECVCGERERKKGVCGGKDKERMVCVCVCMYVERERKVFVKTCKLLWRKVMSNSTDTHTHTNTHTQYLSLSQQWLFLHTHTHTHTHTHNISRWASRDLFFLLHKSAVPSRIHVFIFCNCPCSCCNPCPRPRHFPCPRPCHLSNFP